MGVFLPIGLTVIWLTLLVITPVCIIRFGGWTTVAYVFMVAPLFSFSSVLLESRSPHLMFGWPHPFYSVHPSEPSSGFIWKHVWSWAQLNPWDLALNTCILFIVLIVSMVIVHRWVADTI